MNYVRIKIYSNILTNTILYVDYIHTYIGIDVHMYVVYPYLFVVDDKKLHTYTVKTNRLF